MKQGTAIVSVVLVWWSVSTTAASPRREYLSEYYGLDPNRVSADLYPDRDIAADAAVPGRQDAGLDSPSLLRAASARASIPPVGEFSLFTDETRRTPGLVGSYFNRNLRNVDQPDWRQSQPVAGTRIDLQIDFTETGWGPRRNVGLTAGTDGNWDDFSVQWDGVLVISQAGTRVQLNSDDSSRMWIDVNRNSQFENTATECIDNNWGTAQATTRSLPSVGLAPGTYRVRIQYEEGGGGNVMQLLPGAPHVVRIAYLIPSNRTAQQDAVAKLRTMMRWIQEWYGEQMDRFPFGPRTFALETESDGVTPKIHVCHVTETDARIREDVWGRTLDAANNAGVPLWSSGEVWLLIPEAHVQRPSGAVEGGTALGASYGSGSDPGVAVVGSDFLARFSTSLLTDNRLFHGRVMAEIGPYPLVQDVSFPWFEGNTFSSLCSSITGAVAHELGHALAGLPHNFLNDWNFHGNLMGNGLRGFRGWASPDLYPEEDMRMSYASALVLKNNRYFKRDGVITENTGPSATFLPGAARLYTSATLKTSGLVGSYFNQNLRLSSLQDWRQSYPVAGTRTDASLAFHTGDWGDRSGVGITGGTDRNWDNFSAQWDGFIQVTADKVRLKLKSDDNSRMWIDLNKDGRFADASERIDNNWSGGNGGSGTGQPSGLLPKGTYALRIQYEEGWGDNGIELLVHDMEVEPAAGRIALRARARDASGLSAAVLCGPEGLIGEQPLAGSETDVTIVPMRYDPSARNEVTLAIYDVQGNKSEVPLGFSVKPGANCPPVPQVAVYHSQAMVSTPMTLNAAGSSDPDDAAGGFRVEWDTNGDMEFDTSPTTVRVHTHVPQESGMTLVRARLTDSAGAYSVSSPIAVVVHRNPDERASLLHAREGFENGFIPLGWERAGTLPWEVTSSQQRSGQCSARAGAIGHGQTSTLKIAGPCGAGTFSFYFKTSTESGDKLIFKVNGQQKAAWSGEANWKKAVLTVAAGTYTFEWSYVKNASVSSGQDTVWIDDVVFP